MAFFDVLLTPKSSIGGIEIQASIEEIHSDALQVTEHPVQLGAAITDHAFKRPAEVVLRCGWSNSSTDSLLGGISKLFSGGGFSGESYVDAIYSQLLALQESRTPFDITTQRRSYSNMLVIGLSATTDAKTSNILMIEATCRQIIIVETQATTLPPREAQANPANTAEVENVGTVQPQPATPSAGGSLPPQ